MKPRSCVPGETPDYGYRNANASCAQDYLWPVLEALLVPWAPPPRRALDLGCGNGATAGAMQRLGYEVLGIDASESEVRIAMEGQPLCRFEVGSVYDDLAAQHGRFPLVVSLEVIEHLFSPRGFCETLWDLLEPEGVGIISTPYRGYWKILALALTNRLEAHFDPLWEGGHIKLWSERSLATLLERHGFCDLTLRRAGRVPALAKSMVVAFRRPAAPDLKPEDQ